MSNRKKLLIVLGVVLLIAILVIVNLKKGKGGHIEVQLEKVTRGDITQIVSGTGKIQPEKEIKISANVSAEIIGLYVKEGDIVKKGDLLVELDRTRYEAAAEHAKSNLKSAKASFKKAKSEYKRITDLFKQNLVSLAEKETSEANIMLAESNVDKAKASLKQSLDDLSKTKISSPMDGTVSKLNKESGEIALGSTFQADVIMIVADLSKMEVLAEVDENDVVLVAIGDETKIEVDAIPDTTFMGIVSEIAHTATTRGRGTQEEVTNFEIKIAVTDKVVKLRPGMSSTVDIQTDIHENILSIPIQAVTVRLPSEIKKDDDSDDDVEKEEKPANGDSSEDDEELIEVVFVVDNEYVKIVPVKTGISNDSDMEIISGVEEGTEVVIGSYRAISKTLKDGSLIKISKKKSSEAEK